VDGWLAPFRVAATWPGGTRRLVRRIVVVNLVDGFALYIVARLLPTVEVRSVVDALLVTVVVAVLTMLVRPSVLLLTRWSALVAFAVSLGLNAVLLQVAAYASDAFVVGDFLSALATAFGVAVINSMISGVLSLDEDESFYGNVLKRISRDAGPVDGSGGPGVVFLQVDGLSAPVLRHAVRTGYMPFVAGWIRTGSHRLLDWECDLPSMTSSSQAGILHGNNDDIPGFRWYEKEHARLMVSNRPADAAEIERRVSGPHDLLHPGGTSVANLLSGGAERSLLTTSTVHVSPTLVLGGRAAEELYGYLLNPYAFFRGLWQSLIAIAVEWYESRRQRLRDVQPRMHRGGLFPVLRAVTSVIMRDLTTTAVIEDMQRGVPVLYADLVSYDEIAHHAGPERPEAMRELEAVDRQVRTIVRGAEGAPREYRFVLVSDHGQSLGATFRQRYDEDLETLIARLAAEDTTVVAATEDVETWGYANTLLTQLTSGRRVGARAARRVLDRRRREGSVALGPAGRSPAAVVPGGTPEIVVCAGGNLALAYFPSIDGRASIEEIEALHPGLVARLAAHSGVGFVLVRSETRGGLAVGGRGVHLLDEGRVEGRDPLAVFGPHAVRRLRRLDGFVHCGDLVIVSRLDPATEEVAAFEELIGSHGGLGGPQTAAFVLVPSAWPVPDEPLFGAEALNALFRACLAFERQAAVGDAAADDPAASTEAIPA
jgi:uncharacterized membrane protein YvlD (DUF360 family)